MSYPVPKVLSAVNQDIKEIPPPPPFPQMAFLIDLFEVGGGAVAAKITANVWEIVQLSNLATPLLYKRNLTKIVSLIGIDKDTVFSKQKELIGAKTIVIKILNSIQSLRYGSMDLFFFSYIC